MDPFNPRKNKDRGPEEKIKRDIINFLKIEGWYTIVTHGNLYQHGLPDIFATHSEYRQRWIEVKNPGAYAFTKAQLEVFPKLTANGSGVWILVAATKDEYDKLFKPCNWWQYLSVMK